MLFSSGLRDSEFQAAFSATLPATERGSLLNNLGGSDPRRPWRWVAEKPLKVGSLPPKILFFARSLPTLRRRLCPSFFGVSNCGHQKSSRKSKRIVASEPSFVSEASFAPRRMLFLVVSISLNSWQFVRQAPEISIDLLPEI